MPSTPTNTDDGPLASGQEAYVYARTGSRFFPGLAPHCPDDPVYPPEVPFSDIMGNWSPDNR